MQVGHCAQIMSYTEKQLTHLVIINIFTDNNHDHDDNGQRSHLQKQIIVYKGSLQT